MQLNLSNQQIDRWLEECKELLERDRQHEANADDEAEIEKLLEEEDEKD